MTNDEWTLSRMCAWRLNMSGNWVNSYSRHPSPTLNSSLAFLADSPVFGLVVIRTTDTPEPPSEEDRDNHSESYETFHGSREDTEIESVPPLAKAHNGS